MTTMNVLDSVGATVAVEKPLTPGQAAMAASRPVVIASDQTALPVASHPVTNAGTFAVQSTAQAGSAIMGKVGIDQTTPGTTNGVQVNAALPAGTNVIGHVIVDTAPSTAVTNAGTFSVQVSNANANGQAVMASSAPVVIASNQSSIPVTLATAPALVASTASIGTVQVGVTATANGATASRVNAAASTNATSLKASAGQLYTIDVFNAAAYNVFLKLYNKASAPTVGSDTPVMTIPVQAGGGYSKTWPMGFPFATGIAYAITKLQADADTTVVVAGDLTGNTTWI